MTISNIGGSSGLTPGGQPPRKPSGTDNNKRGADELGGHDLRPRQKTVKGGEQVMIPRHSVLPRVVIEPNPAAVDAAAITAALKKTAHTPDAQVLVVGYSPTGGGHTDRTLNIVQQALKENTITPGSTVIMHVPSKWNNQQRPGSLDSLAQSIKDKGITLVVCGEADKSVQGFLKPSGASDDAKILSRFAQLPNRPDADVNHVSGLKIYRGPGDLDTLPSISAKDLMFSLKQTLDFSPLPGGPTLDVTRRKVRVLTDMDPALQKAAAQAGVPGRHRVDQQNHAILLDLDDMKANLKSINAVLAKVLSGKGETVSHIGLGDKNTLLNMKHTAQAVGIRPDTTKAEALKQVAGLLLEHGQPAHVAASSGQTEGIMKHGDIQNADDVKNIIYVYAHKNQDPIAATVRAEIDKGEAADPAFKNTLFVFCGKKEALDVDGLRAAGKAPAANVLHVAYLGDADGITTSGAGAHGEFAYLHKAGGSQAGLLALPIKGHNEQKANADYLAMDPATQVHVTVREDTSDMHEAVHAFVRERADKAAAKYGQGDMGTLLRAVNDEASYVQQAHDLLFNLSSNSDEGSKIEQREQEMRDSPLLTANRRFLKLVFQALDQVDEKAAQGGDVLGALEVKLKKKEGWGLEFSNLKQFYEELKDDRKLADNLSSTVPLNIHNVVLLNDVRNFFQNLQSGSPVSAAELRNRIEHLKEKFGETLTTGF